MIPRRNYNDETVGNIYRREMSLPERLTYGDFGMFGYPGVPYFDNSIKVVDPGNNLNIVKQFILLPIK